MARIAGVNIPVDKVVHTALTYIHGIGDHNSKKFKEMFKIEQEANALSDTLSDSGYSLKDITHVVLTHLHFDHAGGNTIYNKERLVPAFPNANYWIS